MPDLKHWIRLALGRSGWVPIQPCDFPSWREHVEVCRRLGLKPGKEAVVDSQEVMDFGEGT